MLAGCELCGESSDPCVSSDASPAWLWGRPGTRSILPQQGSWGLGSGHVAPGLQIPGGHSLFQHWLLGWGPLLSPAVGVFSSDRLAWVAAEGSFFFFPTALKQKYPHLYESPSDIACGCSSREPSSSRQTSSAGGSPWYQTPPGCHTPRTPLIAPFLLGKKPGVFMLCLPGSQPGTAQHSPARVRRFLPSSALGIPLRSCSLQQQPFMVPGHRRI